MFPLPRPFPWPYLLLDPDLPPGPLPRIPAPLPREPLEATPYLLPLLLAVLLARFP
jgi:hypothetical protein